MLQPPGARPASRCSALLQQTLWLVKRRIDAEAGTRAEVAPAGSARLKGSPFISGAAPFDRDSLTPNELGDIRRSEGISTRRYRVRLR